MTHGKNKKNFSISTAEKFIAAITQHIPDPSFQMVRYVGWYSNRMRGDRKKQEPDEEEKRTHGGETEIIDVSEYKPRKIPPPTWRECIKKVWEVDPLKCPHCQGEMKIISFIKEHEVIRKILMHLDLWRIPKQPRPPPKNKFSLPQHNPYPAIAEQEEFFDDGWPGYDEPVFSVD